MDFNKKGIINTSDMQKFYNAYKHPNVIKGGRAAATVIEATVITATVITLLQHHLFIAFKRVKRYIVAQMSLIMKQVSVSVARISYAVENFLQFVYPVQDVTAQISAKSMSLSSNLPAADTDTLCFPVTLMG